MAKKSFILHLDSLAILADMPDDFAGRFIKAIRQFKITGELPEGDFALRMAVVPFVQQFARDEARYNNTVVRNQNNGKNGGRPKGSGKAEQPSGINNNPENPVGFSETQHNPSEPKKADSDSDSGSPSEKEERETREREDFLPEAGNEQKPTIRPAYAPTIEQATVWFAHKGSLEYADGFMTENDATGWQYRDGTPIKRWEDWAQGFLNRRRKAAERAAAKEQKNKKSSGYVETEQDKW